MTDETDETPNIWEQVLVRLRQKVDSDEFRRWFASTAYASDSGDLIIVWTPTEAVRRHLIAHYDDEIRRTLETLDRSDTSVRFVVSGFDDEEDEDDAIR